MKYKMNEAPNLGVGRPRASMISNVHSSTRNNKVMVNNNDNTVRRSSRRATIERRVWAVPKKGSKFSSSAPCLSAKRKENTQIKKDKRTTIAGKGEIRNATKSKSFQGIKRGSNLLDEEGSTRKKVKKKLVEGVDASSMAEFADDDDKLYCKVQSDKCFHEGEMIDEERVPYEMKCTAIDLNCEIFGNTEKGDLLSGDEDERTSGDHSENSDDDENDDMIHPSQKNYVDSKDDLGKEETMCIDDISLHKAVIVEVVSDYDGPIVNQESSLKEDLNEEPCKVMSNKVLETNGASEETPKLLEPCSELPDSGKDRIMELKNENLHSTLPYSNNCYLEEQKPSNIIELGQKQGINPESDSIDLAQKQLCTNKSNFPGTEIFGVPSVYDPSFDVGSNHRNASSSPQLSTLSKLEKPLKNSIALCNSPNSDTCLESSSVDKSKSVSLARDDSLESSGNGDVLKSSVNLEWALLAKEQEVDDEEFIQSSFNKTVSIPEHENPKLECFLDQSYLKRDGLCNKVESLSAQQCNSEFDPGGNSNEKCLPSPNNLPKSTSLISDDDSDSASTETDAEEEIVESDVFYLEPVTVIVDETSNTQDCQVFDSPKSDSKEECLLSSDTHIAEKTDIQQIESTYSVTEFSDQCENRHISLQLTEDTEVDGEEHVSLSVALAQLVDADCTDEADGTETLTIHSAVAVAQVNDEKKLPVDLGYHSEDQTKRGSMNDDEVEEEDEGKLFIKEEDDLCKFEVDDKKSEIKEESEDDDAEEDEESIIELEEHPASKVRDADVAVVEKIDKPSQERILEVEEERPQVNLQKPKKQLPPLIKISSRPPTIKTPLKCPECPMQFCTVRSLFWHFGLHGARSQDASLPPILLQDLVAPWDSVSGSDFLPQTPDLLEKEKSLQAQDDDRGNDFDKNQQEGINTSELIHLMSNSSPCMPIISSHLSIGNSSLSSSFSSSSVSDTVTPGDKVPDKGRSSPLKLLRTEECSGSNGDVILKIPIPRLKRKLQASPSVRIDKSLALQPAKTDKFINILPKLPSHKRLISRSAQANPQSNFVRSSISPTPQVSIQPSTPLDLLTVTPQPSLIPNITVMSSSSSQVQIQPLATSTGLISSQSLLSSQPNVSSPSLLSTLSNNQLTSPTSVGLSVPSFATNTKNISPPSHITLIPMDNISSLNPGSQVPKELNQVSGRRIVPSPVPSPKPTNPVDGIVEKDGLVMINSNLALRIVSSLPTTLDTNTNTTNTTTIQPISNPCVNNLTILPQVEGNRYSSFRETTKTPDILTIVPQVDLSKRLSLLKDKVAVNSPPVSISTPTSSASTSSQIVKLYLLQSKESSSQNAPKVSLLPEALRNLNGVEFKPFIKLNGKEGEDYRDECVSDDEEEDHEDGRYYYDDYDDEEDDDDDERSMVIADIKEEGEEDLMDPLSLCAVTMEDEHLESANFATSNTNSPSNVPISSVVSDKTSPEKIEVKIRGKKEKLDIVKYEARKYVCCYCNRRFGWSTDLKRHVILHTGERPFQCKVCPTAFTRKFLLQNHMKRMHPDNCKMSDLWP